MKSITDPLNFSSFKCDKEKESCFAELDPKKMTSDMGSLLVSVYTEEEKLSVKQDCPLTVEDVCKKCASDLNIDSSLVQLFGLIHNRSKLWLSPKHLLTECDLRNDEYFFRIRFHPEISVKNNNFLHYLHCQYRHCFTKEFHVDQMVSSDLFGLGLLDMITNSYEKQFTSNRNVFQSEKYKSFFPEKELKKYNWFQKIFLKLKLKKFTRNKHKEYWGVTSCQALRNTYISKIKDQFHSQIINTSYTYKDKDENEKIVSIEERDSKFFVVFERESINLKLVRSVKIKTKFVEIYFKGTSPKMLQMEPDVAESFVSAMDGLYRLTYDYHYGICDQVTSPRIMHLQTLGCYDHIKEDTIFAILMERAVQKGCFLMRMSPNSIDIFDVYTLDPETSEIKKFTVGPHEDLKFKSLESLQQTYTDLEHKLIPNHFERCDLLFCGKAAVSQLEFEPLEVEMNNKVYQSSDICGLQEIPLHTGIFTETYQAYLKSCKTEICIKMLRNLSDFDHYTQVFMEGINSMLEVSKCLSFLQIKGVTLAPRFGLVTEYFHLNANTYLAKNNLTIEFILKMAFTVAEGLESLKRQGIVHGDICCQNLRVFNDGTVKISDSSIVSKVYLLQEDHAIYKSRLPWLDPQLQNSKSTPTFESDIFSYGTMLCEMLCLECKPPKQNTSLQAYYEAPCRLLFNICENEEDAQLAMSVKKQLHELLIKCRSYKAENRPQPKDISTILQELIHETDIIKKNLPTNLLTNCLCDHAWKAEVFFPEQISVALKTIQNKSRLKVPKSIPEYIIDAKHFKKIKEIGSGAYGAVYLAMYSTPLYKKEVAIKTYQRDESDITNEIKVLHKLKHERIITFIGFSPGMGIVMEYVNGGDLLSKIKNTKRVLPGIKNVLLEIIEGMEYLQSMKIIHRDLAARNVLLTENDHVKITDFGLSKQMENEYYLIKTTRSLPMCWSAPDLKKISSKSDVWSFGIVMWECYSCGAQPKLIDKCKFQDYINALKSGKRLLQPKLCPKMMYEIMQECWNIEPLKRPDFTNLKKKFLNMM